MRRRLRAAALILAGIILVPIAVSAVARGHAPAPDGLLTPISEFADHVRFQLDRNWGRARFVGAEIRASDNLTILYFELDLASPWLKPELAYLASRCVPLDDLVPLGMSGGTIAGDPADDVEIAFLKSDAQPPCLGNSPP